jgi:GTP-binding protein EngB required for normal cell division
MENQRSRGWSQELITKQDIIMGRFLKLIIFVSWAMVMSNLYSMEPAKKDVDNILVVGETGSGKSSLINMLFEKNLSPANSSPSGVTAEPKLITMGKYNFFDTPGLDEAPSGTVPPLIALIVLQKLIADQKNIDLVIYVTKVGRMSFFAQFNQKFLRDFLHIKSSNIPILYVFTHENEGEKEEWAMANKYYIKENYTIGKNDGAISLDNKFNLKEPSKDWPEKKIRERVWKEINNRVDKSRAIVKPVCINEIEDKELLIEALLKRYFIVRKLPEPPYNELASAYKILGIKKKDAKNIIKQFISADERLSSRIKVAEADRKEKEGTCRIF